MYAYILLAIVILVLYLSNIPSFSIEEFQCQGEINLKSTNDPKLQKNNMNKKSNNFKKNVGGVDNNKKTINLSAKNAKKIDKLTQEINQLKQQQIVLDKKRNPEYAKLKPTKINDTYKLLVKDPPENEIRKEADAVNGYNHMRPDVKNPFQTDGYSYISPALWDLRVWSPRPPVCIPAEGQKADIQPIPTSGTILDALPWQENAPRFTYNEVYDPKYYGPGYEASY